MTQQQLANVNALLHDDEQAERMAHALQSILTQARFCRVTGAQLRLDRIEALCAEALHGYWPRPVREQAPINPNTEEAL